MAGNDQQADNSSPPGPSSTKQDESGKHHENIVNAVDEEGEAAKSIACTLEEPNANRGKVDTIVTKKNNKSGIKVVGQNNLRRSQRTPVKVLTPEKAKAKSSKNNGEKSRLVIENQAEKLMNSKKVNTGEMKQEVELDQQRRTDEEIRKMVILELAKHRQEQATLRESQNEVDQAKKMNANKSPKTGSHGPTESHSPEGTTNFNSRKIRVMQSLGLMAPPGSLHSRKRAR